MALNLQNLKTPTSEEARRNGAKGGSSPKRRATLDAKKLMKSILTSSPVMSNKTRNSLTLLGVDVNDPKLTTNAAVIQAVIASKAMNGDLTAAKMALEMGGQPVDAKTLVELERLKLERDKFELERFLALQNIQPQQTAQAVEDPIVTALKGISGAITADKCDTPEDINNDEEGV